MAVQTMDERVSRRREWLSEVLTLVAVVVHIAFQVSSKVWYTAPEDKYDAGRWIFVNDASPLKAENHGG
jgi:hypothetical protein